MKKLLVVSLLSVVLCVFLISCQNAASDVESAEFPSSSSEEGGENLETSVEAEASVSSEDDSNFTKEEAIAYFTAEEPPQFKSVNSYVDLGVLGDESLRLPFSEFEKWIDGTSEISFTGFWLESGESISIYDFFSESGFYKPFVETTFYGIKIKDVIINLYDGVVLCTMKDSWYKETGEALYTIYYSYNDVKEDRITLSVRRLAEHNTNYAASLGNISDYFKALGKGTSYAETKTLKIYDCSTDKYYDVEAICGPYSVDFIFNKLVFEIRFYNREDSFEITDDILNNIVIMDLLEE